jgi:hypothetical protein
MLKKLFACRLLTTAWLVSITFFFSNCYSYRVSTQAQAGAETTVTVTTHSFLWGLLKNPKEIHTPVCDSLGANGMAEVTVKNNFGFAFITVATLGIWCPMRLEWKCAKPCKKTGTL